MGLGRNVVSGTLKSGDMAKSNRITKKAMRVYEGKGLITPAMTDPSSGYHYFGIAESAKLDLVSHLQAIGISLDEIKAIADSQDMGNLTKSIENALDRIEEKQQELEQMRKLAEAYKRSCDSYWDSHQFGQITLTVLPERLALAFPVPPCESHLGKQSPFDERERWEWLTRHARAEMTDAGFSASLAHRMGFIVSPERLGEEFSWGDCVIVLVDKATEIPSDNLVALPKGYHLVVYYDSFEATPQDTSQLYLSRAKQLLDYAKSNNLEVTGNFVCEEICRFPHLLDAKASSLHRYCLPVAPKLDAAP